MRWLARILGPTLVLLGLAFNRPLLERYVLYDGTIEAGPVRFGLLLVQIVVIVAGVYWMRRPPPLAWPGTGNALLLAFSSVFALGAAEIGFRVIDPDYRPRTRAYVGQYENVESPRFVPDPHTGWRMHESRTFEWRFDGRITSYRSNRDGFRADREFGPATRPLIALAGDSFTWGVGVQQEETHGARLEERLAGAEVRSFAMPGFAIDQMWMSVRHQALPFSPDWVVVAFIDDDFARSLTAYRDGEGLNKPRFRGTWRGELVPETAADAPPSWWPDWRARLHLASAVAYRVERLRPFGDWWELNLAMLERIHRESEAAGARTLFVRLPQRGQRGFETLGEELERRGLPFLDVGDRMGMRPKDFFLRTNEHMGPAGHARVAELVEARLRDADPDWISSLQR